VDPTLDDDPYTVPLALASRAHEETITLFDDGPDTGFDGGFDEGGTRLLEEEDPWVGSAPERVPVAQRLRRGLLLLSGALAVGAAATAYPWLATALLLVVVWLLRSASLAASATVDRRRLRGAKWYDPVLYLLGAPWHAVRSIPGTLLLVLWSLGLALADVLVCYALAATVETTLFSAGLVLAASLWLGPGGSRVRGPLSRVVNPLSVRAPTWLVAEAVVLAAAGALGFLAVDAGPSWAPDNSAPLSQLDLDGVAGRLGR
jgi:hypothetical protein